MADDDFCTCGHRRRRHSIGPDQGALCEDCDECKGFEARPELRKTASCDRCPYETANEREFGRECPEGSDTWSKCRGWISDPRGGTAKAAKNADGTYWYVRERSEFARRTRTLVAAPSLKEAKAKHGWTRENYASISIHRATINEVAALGSRADG